MTANSNETQLQNVVKPAYIYTISSVQEYDHKEIKKMPTIEERIITVKKQIEQLERKKRIEDRNNREAQEKIRKKQYYLIGELVAKYFPEVLSPIEKQTEEDDFSFKLLESFLSVLSEDAELLSQLEQRAKNNAQDEDECVSGHEEK